MNLSSANRALHLVTRLLDTDSATEPIIDLGPQKPEIPLGTSSKPLPVCEPERQGIPSRHIANFLRELADAPSLRMHSVLILRNGHLVCKAAFGAQDVSLPRMTFSACKSVTALAIGLLMDDGLLHPEDKLTDLFPNDCGPVSKRLMKDLTLAHVLSMQTGNQFNEAGSMTEEDWTRAYFSAPSLETSRKFHYNSLNTYILAVLVTRITGHSLTDFLRKRLFAPMGIEHFYWETSPEGVEKGGWGLYMTAEDLGKLGQLVMDGGCWEGKQLISSDFLQKATQTHAVTPEEYGDFNYGWQIWVGRKENTFLFNGMLGQNVLGFRDSGIVVVSHAGNDETFQSSVYFPLVSKYFGASFPKTLPKNPSAERELAKAVAALSDCGGRIPLKAEFERFSGRRFVTVDKNAVSTGLLPLTLQAVQNCYTKGLQAITVTGTRTAPVVLYEERDQLHYLVCGTKEPAYQVLDFRGNSFRAAVQARFTHDEEERPVLRIRIDFLETPCTRILKLFLTQGGMLLKQEESPGLDYLTHAMSTLLQGSNKTLTAAVLGSAEQGYLRWKTEKIFLPALKFTEEA